LSAILDEHRQYLSDEPRLGAYRRAIGETVKPGDVVLDLGAGTGIMGLLACRAGAARVYSIEAESMIGLAREICRANGFGDRVTFVKGLSTQVDLPEKVDVAVCDQIGRFGFEAGIVEYSHDVVRRFLKPAGALIPSHITLLAAPVECLEMFAQVDFWKNSSTGFDLTPARAIAVNTGYPIDLRAEHLLGEPVTLTTLGLSTITPVPMKFEAEIVIGRRGTLHGIGGWFSARLSQGATLTNSPLAADSIKRRNVFLPIDRPVSVEPGDRVSLAIQIVPTEVLLTWRVEVRSGRGESKGSFTHSTWRGMLIAREDLSRTRPGFVPKLSARGEARLTVLSLCDGKRPLEEIEQEVFARHAPLFRSRDEAATFVAEVVTRYSV
jgi:protein arginine N-methyltransferase 1